jgi:ABC-type transporter MlaC component
MNDGHANARIAPRALNDTGGIGKLSHMDHARSVIRRGVRPCRRRFGHPRLSTIGAFMARAALLILLAASASWPVAAQDGSGEQAVVRQVLGAAAVRDPFAQAVVRRSFDVPAIAAFVLGSYWPAASDDERRDFVELLAESIAQGLVRRRLAEDDAYAIIATRRLANGDAVVTSRVRLAAGDVARLDWRLRGTPPLIVDLAIDGRSTSVTRRDDYLARLHHNGGTVRALIAGLRSGPRSDP